MHWTDEPGGAVSIEVHPSALQRAAPQL
ncbi:MAG: hypothetical protein JWM62_1327, partial [Frankiales bacterium]|nr:hypothetical protein [Frankiales bacterium]